MFSDGVLETGHVGEVVDVAVDANGRRLATASDDGSIHLYEVDTLSNSAAANGSNAASGSADVHPSSGGREAGATTSSNGGGGHQVPPAKAGSSVGKEGSFSSTGPSWRLFGKISPPLPANGGEGAVASSPVTCIAWAPPAYYGCAVVSCTEDGQVRLWSDFRGSGQFEAVFSQTLASPGQCVAWAPPEYGKLFAVGCASGLVTVFTGQEQTWDVHAFPAHQRGCCGLAFAPFFPPGALLMVPLEAEVDPAAPPPPVPIAPPRMATCGAGKKVKVWVHAFAPPAETGPEAEDAPPESIWTPTELVTGPLSPESTASTSFERVSWAPNVGLPYTYIAAASDDGFVVVWSQDGPFRPDSPWQFVVLPQQMPDRVTSLSWSSTGTFLLVSCADGTASMWKEVAVGFWELVSEMENPATA